MTPDHHVYRAVISILRDEHVSLCVGQSMYDIEDLAPCVDLSYGNLACRYPMGFLKQLSEAWGLSEERLVKRMVVPAPSPLLNKTMGATLRRVYTRLPGEFDYMGRLPINQDVYRFRNGVILPVSENSETITGLRFYRYPKDRDSFLL